MFHEQEKMFEELKNKYKLGVGLINMHSCTKQDEPLINCKNRLRELTRKAKLFVLSKAISDPVQSKKIY